MLAQALSMLIANKALKFERVSFGSQALGVNNLDLEFIKNNILLNGALLCCDMSVNAYYMMPSPKAQAIAISSSIALSEWRV